MYSKMIICLYDDNDTECRIGDRIIIQTNKMDCESIAVIKDIRTNMVTLEFDDPLIGFQPVNVRLNDIILSQKY